jgi:hypothetical protein
MKVQTAKQRVNVKKRELEAPDEVTTHLQQLSEHLSKHFQKYLLGLGALVLVTLGVQYMVNSSAQKSVDESNAFRDAVAVYRGTVATFQSTEIITNPFAPATEEPEVGSPDFGTLEERRAAALKSIESAKAEVSDELAVLLIALKGTTELALSEPAAAGETLAAFASEASESSLLPIIFENQARAAHAGGDVSAAAGYYEKIAELPNQYYKVVGNLFLGDLYNPRINAGEASDATRSSAYYGAALEALTPGEGQVLQPALRGFRAEIKRRQALIEG